MAHLMKARDVFYKVAKKDIVCHPFKIMMRSGEYAAGDYYFLSIKNVLRAIKIEGPDLQIIEIDSYENVGTKAEILQFKREGSSIRVRKSIIAGHNLWRDDFEGRGVRYEVFVSDSLQREIKKAKLTGVKFTELIET